MTRQRTLNTRIPAAFILFFTALTFLIALAAPAQQLDAAKLSANSSAASFPMMLGTAGIQPVSAAKLHVDRTAIVAQDSGNLSFLPAVTYGSGGYYTAQAVAIADLNGDGKPDIVVSNWYDASGTHGLIGVLLGNGDGTFQPVVTYESGGVPDAGAVAVADVNGDGKLDIVVSACAATVPSCGSANGIVSVLLGNGDGTFRSAVNYDSGAPRTVGVAIADLTGDGKPDLIVTNYYGESNGDGTVAVLLNNGEGSFSSAVLYDSGASNPNGVTSADVNGDGIPDLLVVNRCDGCAGGGVLGVLLGKGNGTFGPVQIYPTGGANSAWLAAADLNGDGKLDVVVANLNIGNPTGTVSVLLGAEDGTFEPAVTYDSGAYAAAQPAIADLNGDGHLDIAVANCNCGPGPGIIGVLLGRGDGTFEPVVTFSSGAYNATALAVADLNKDGKLDVVSANQGGVNGTSSVGVLLNNTGRCVGKCSTSTALTSTLNPSTYGQSVTWTATVKTTGSIAPAGTVNFMWDGYSIGTATLNASSVATMTRSILNAYSYPLAAVYEGDANNAPSTSAILNQVVKETTSAAKLTSSPNPSTKGQAVTFTATITSPTVVPTGPVTFTSETTVLGTAQLREGKATFTTSALAVGSTAVKATYSGDSNIAESSASLTQTVQP
jgi:hypothetical protein